MYRRQRLRCVNWLLLFCSHPEQVLRLSSSWLLSLGTPNYTNAALISTNKIIDVQS